MRVTFSLIPFAVCFLSHKINGFTVSDIPLKHQIRFSADKAKVQDEYNKWKESEEGKYAMENKLWGDSEHSTDPIKTVEEHIRRFFLSKLRIEEQERLNPHAQFSTNTRFALLTADEFKSYMGQGYQPLEDDVKKAANATLTRNLAQEVDVPTGLISMDWTTSDCIPPVRDQGSHCGSCYAITGVAALESAYCIKNKFLPQLSPQELISCSSSFKPNNGCYGGQSVLVLEYAKTKGGLCSDADYPYEQWKSSSVGTCKNTCDRFKIPIPTVVTTDTTEHDLLQAVDRQPVAIAVSSNNDTWQFYRGGIVTGCQTKTIDHNVLVVGYGTTEDGKAYIKIQNTWGHKWGERGYMRLMRNTGRQGTCSYLAARGSFPKL